MDRNDIFDLCSRNRVTKNYRLMLIINEFGVFFIIARLVKFVGNKRELVAINGYFDLVKGVLKFFSTF